MVIVLILHICVLLLHLFFFLVLHSSFFLLFFIRLLDFHLILHHIPCLLQQRGHILQRPHGGSSALLRLFRQQSVDHGTHGVTARRAHLQQPVKHTQMDLLAGLCVLCECAVDERANGGDGGWLGERRTQLVI